MPTVPSYSTPTVAPEGVPGVRQQVPAHLREAAMLGPHQTEQAGKGVLAGGGELMREITDNQIQRNEAAGKEFDANLLGAVSTILTDFQSQKGKNAVDTYEATVDKLKGLPQQLGQSLQNPAQQEMVRNVSQLRVQAAVNDATKHAQQQSDVYHTAASQTRIKVAQDAAATAYSPVSDNPAASFDHEAPEANSLYQQSLQTIRTEAESLADRKGLTDPDLRAAFVKESMAKAYIGTLGHLIDKKAGTPADIKVAAAYFEKVKDQLPAEAQDKIRTVLEAGAQKDQALTLAIDVKGRISDIGAQEKELDGLFKAGKVNAEVHEMALQKLRADNAQRRAEQSETDKSMLGGVWDLARNGGSLTDLSPSQLAYVRNRGLGPHVDAIFKNAEKADFDDSRAYTDLARMSAEDPGGFARMDLATMSGQLTKAHWNHLVEVQRGINRQDVKSMDAVKVVHNAIQDAKSSLLSAGLNLSPKPDTEAARKLSQFESSLRDSLLAAQQANSDRPLTREQARDLTMGILKEQALSGTGYFGSTIGQTRKPAWQMTPEERAAPWEVPPGDRAQIAASLKRAGMQPTEANIQRAYKLSQGVR